MILTYLPATSIIQAPNHPQIPRNNGTDEVFDRPLLPVSVRPANDNLTGLYELLGGTIAPYNTPTNPIPEIPVVIPQSDEDITCLIEKGHDAWAQYVPPTNILLPTNNPMAQTAKYYPERRADDASALPCSDHIKTILANLDDIVEKQITGERNIPAFHALRTLEKYIAPFKEFYGARGYHAFKTMDPVSLVAATNHGINWIMQAIATGNQGLLYTITKRYERSTRNRENLADGLHDAYAKAIMTFDLSQSTTFATWAGRLMENKARNIIKIEKRARRNFGMQSLDRQTKYGRGTYADRIQAPTPTDYGHIEQTVGAILDQLPSIQRRIVMMRFGIGDQEILLQKQVAENIGYSQRTTQNNERKALNQIRKIIREHHPELIHG